MFCVLKERLMEILLVEDDDGLRDLASTILKAQGHSVIEAADGETAIEKFNSSEASIVLLDWLLPGIYSGIDVANKIKQVRYCYIIMLTAMSQKQNGEEALNAGAKDYIEKPFEVDELMEAVDLGVAVVTARQKYFKRLEKRGVSVELIEEFA
jgi:DNA-binding response OmpR family regulator